MFLVSITSAVRATRRLTAGVVCLALFSSCNRPPQEGSVYDAVAQIDLSARPERQVSQTGSLTKPASKGWSFFGTSSEPAAAAGGGRAVTGTSEGYEVDFENTPIPTVAKAIVTDILHVDLVIDPRVTGNVTLSSGRPLKANELLILFENGLKLAGANLVKEAAGYRIIPAAESVGSARVDRGGAPAAGFGVTMVPLRFVAAENMMKLIDSFAAKPGAVKVGPSANVLLVQGTSEERRSVMESIQAFDQDWMRGQSVGIYPVASAPPETVIAELRRIMDAGEGGNARGLVQFQPIARMNAVLVVAKTPDALRIASTWIRRLDRSDNAASQTKVYRVKYGTAKQLASLLNDAFSSGGSGGGLAGGDTPEGGLAKAAAAPARPGNQNGGLFGNGLFGGNGAGGEGGGLFGSARLRGGRTGVSLPEGNEDAAQTASAAGFGDGGGRAEGRIKITPDSASNSLIIFADRERMVMVERVLQQLDRPRLQVAIEATIAEVSLTDELQYGVQYLLRSGDVGLPANKGSIGFSGLAGPLLERVLPGFNLVLGPGQNPRVVIDALSTRTHVKVLSNPSVVAMDNQAASIQVGDQVPVATSQATLVGTTSTGLLTQPAFPVANNIDYRNTGVILRVLPRVAANGHVTLEVEQEISNVVKKNSGTDGGLTPTVSQRVIKSTISVSSGQTVLLGGLISDRRAGERQGIPILQDIAYLGDLFARKQTARDRTELIIFIQPRIIQDAVDAQSVAEEMRAKMLFSVPARR